MIDEQDLRRGLAMFQLHEPEQRDALANLLAAFIDGLHRKLGEHRYTHVGEEPL